MATCWIVGLGDIFSFTFTFIVVILITKDCSSGHSLNVCENNLYLNTAHGTPYARNFCLCNFFVNFALVYLRFSITPCLQDVRD